MRFVIATLPDVKFNLGRDLSLVKACALYGDETVLFSPTYAGSAPLLDFVDRPLLHQLIYLALLTNDPGFVVGEKLTKRERAARIKAARETSEGLFSKASTVVTLLSEARRSGGADAELARIALELARIALEVRPLCENVEKAWSDAKDLVPRTRELAKAEEMGLIRIEKIHDTPSFYYDQTKLQLDVSAELARADSYGALDERFLSRLEKPSPGATQKLRAARVGAEIFKSLPGFSAATLEEIRDIRSELAPHLAVFRKAIVDISCKIQSAPWDRDFPHDVERELRLRLYPAVSQIEVQMRDNSYLKEIVHRAATNPLVVPAASAFGLLLSSAAHAPALIGQVVSTMGGAGLLAFEAHKAWQATRRKIEGNEFFFYYRASRLLKTRR